ncbi:M42 family metallopeptidase [Oscillospiraceae bacterium OttesenSCG-928-F05]|nr:M42 family metallopeptidase [Oscillospiraceae bacterium OttesenSCG-928-F05]
MMELFELLKTLVSEPSPSGGEAAVRACIRALVEPVADTVEEDVMGNLIALKKAKNPGAKRVMLSAHMDSVGLIVTFIEEQGFLRFSNLGGVNPTALLHAPVRFANGTRGVIAKEDKVAVKDLKLHDLFIDIGAGNREAAEACVRVSDVALYATETVLQGDRVFSPYLDNRIGCAVLLDVFRRLETPENDVYAVFSVQEELGLRGAQTVAFAVEPDVGLAIDVTRTGDTPGVKPKMACVLGGGAAIKVMDRSLICAPELVRGLERCAKAHGVPYQFEVLEAGGTDAGAIQRSRGGVLSGAVSIPARYIHAPVETVCMGDAQAAAELLRHFAREAL